MRVTFSWMKRYLPAGVKTGLRRFLPGTIKFDGPYETWAAAEAACQGYEDADILARVLEAGLKVQRGEATFERDGVLFETLDVNAPMLEHMMAAAAANDGELHVLDFGGSLGSTYFQHREALQSIDKLSWHIVEQAHFVAAGQQHFKVAQLAFFETIAAACAVQKPTLILLSSVAQYLQDPIAILTELGRLGASSIYIDRTPFVVFGESQILVQRVPKSINEASYPLWVLREADVLSAFPEYQWCSKVTNEEGAFRVKGCQFYFSGLSLEAVDAK
jgi:putative methyltransferase (TIGR04325 family)